MGNKPNPFLTVDDEPVTGRFLGTTGREVLTVEGACGALEGGHPSIANPMSCGVIAAFIVRLPL
jgi:hypothetical protein